MIVSSIMPADASVDVTANSPVIAHLEESPGGVNVALVTIVVNGVTCTVANGRLEYWGHRRISGGVLVDDWSSVYFGTLCAWFDASLARIDVEIIYDGTTIAAVSWTASDLEPGWRGGNGTYETWYTSPAWAHGAAQGWYTIADAYVAGAERVGYYYIDPAPTSAVDGWYMLGHIAWSDGATAAIVGRIAPSDGAAAMTVYGYAHTDTAAGMIVQGWARTATPASAIVARTVRRDWATAMLTGRPTTTAGCAAMIIYGTTARTHIEVRSITATTAAMLATLGITRG